MLKQLVTCLCFMTAATTAHAKQSVDLALVLAVDCSGSVDEREYRLQMDGLASALKDREVLEAITAGPSGRIAVNVMLWEDANAPRPRTGWRLLASQEDTAALADDIEAFAFAPGRGTGMGAAIAEAIGLLEAFDGAATRHVVDVSGDGRESWTFEDPRMFLQQVKAILKNRTITVNGLAITNNEPDLVRYYEDNVIFGASAFVLEAKDFESFSKAMKIKLLREIRQDMAMAPSSPNQTALSSK
jgi:hypothetical protein